MRATVLQQATRNYEALADAPLQMQLAREIAQARGAELTLAYRNVVMVAAGFKRRTTDMGDELTKVPCVIFVVRNKWRKGERKDDDVQHLPRQLLTHASSQRGRVLVAVPTDVQVETRYASARPQSDRAICVRSSDHSDEYGTLTAVVEVRGDSQSVMRAISPLHVLTPTFCPTQGGPMSGASIEQANGLPQRTGAPTLGSSLRIGGQLVPGPDISFDVQLIDISDLATVAHMLQGVPLSAQETFLVSLDRYDQLTLADPLPAIEILLPDNHPTVNAPRPRLFPTPAGTSTHAYPIPYSLADGSIMMVHHWELIQLQCPAGQETVKGDSGAPVVLWLSDGSCTLVGMIIAGNGGLCHVLPAWMLLFPDNYLGTLQSECQLTLSAQPLADATATGG